MSTDPARAAEKKGATKALVRPTPIARRGALERSVHIVEVLIDAGTPMSIADIAAATALEPNTVHRLTRRLVAAGYAHRNPTTRRLCAGVKALFPMSLSHPLNRLRQEAREQLRLLRERYYESACLILFMGLERVIIDFVQGQEPLSPLYETRLTTPLHASATGVILLAGLSHAERSQVLGREPFPAPAAHAVSTYAALELQLEAFQRQGYAVAKETTFIGVSAIAAPIRAQGKTIGCIAITGSSETITEDQILVIGEALKSAAALISLGAPSVKAVAHFLGVS